MPQLPPEANKEQQQPTPSASPAPDSFLNPAGNPVGPSVDPEPTGLDLAADPSTTVQSVAPPIAASATTMEATAEPEVFGPNAPDDFTSQYAQHRDDLESVAADDDLKQFFGAKKAEEPAPKEVKKSSSIHPAGALAIDLIVGNMEMPTQIVGGIRDAIQNTINLPEDISNAIRTYSVTEQVKDRKTPQLPNVSEPKSVTGGLVRGTATFLAGFYGAGKVTEGVQVASKLGKAIQGMAKGSAAAFTAFSGEEKRFSDFIQEHPSLKNPLNELLASDPKDTALEGRVKNALEGELPGAIVTGLVSAAKAIRFGRVLEAAERSAKTAIGEEMPVVRETRPEQFSSIGDPSKDSLFIKQDKVPDVKPGEIANAPKESAQYVNWAKIETPEDIKSVMKTMASKGKADIEAGARGTRTWEQTKLSAQQEDAWKILTERRTGEAMNAEQSLAARNLWVTSASKLKEVAALADSAPTTENLFAFRKMLATHHAIQQEVLAARTETARALNAWKIPAGSGIQISQQIEEMIKNSGGPDTTRFLAEKIAKFGQAGMHTAVEKMVYGSMWAKTKDAVSQVWINSLLSNPATHVANGLSNIAAAVQQIGERKVAEMISQKFGTEGGVALGESAAMAHATLSASYDAFSAFSKKIKTIKGAKDAAEMTKSFLKEPIDMNAATKVESQQRLSGLSAERWNISSDSILGRTMDLLDVGTQAPGRLLAKTDEVFKSIGYRMELHAQAVRLATNEIRGKKVSPEKFKEMVGKIVQNPPTDIHIESVNAATYQTFQQKPAETLKRLGDAVQSMPFGRIILPFKNTPINIFTWTFERTPLAPLIKQSRADFMAGGARRDIMLAKMAMGTTILQLGMDQALSGRITGKGPSEPGQRAAWLRAGNQPYSVKLGDTSVSINKLGPIGQQLGMAADIAEACINAQGEIANKDFEEVMAAAIFSAGNVTLNQSYMQGTAELINALSNPDQKAESYLMRLAGSAVPAGVANVARQVDPYMRTADGIIDSLRRRIPGLSADLPLYRDLWGRPVDYRSGAGFAYDMFSPVYIKNGSHSEAIDKEILRLEYYPNMPSRKVSYNGISVELDGKQYSRYCELAGNEAKHPAYNMGAKDFLNAVVEGKHPYSVYYNTWSDGPDGGKAGFIRITLDEYRDRAKKQLFEEDGALAASYSLKKDAQPGKFRPEFYGK